VSGAVRGEDVEIVSVQVEGVGAVVEVVEDYVYPERGGGVVVVVAGFGILCGSLGERDMGN
jgi:hypothetical protein